MSEKHKIEVNGRFFELDKRQHEEWPRYVKDEQVREAQRQHLEKEQGVRTILRFK